MPRTIDYRLRLLYEVDGSLSTTNYGCYLSTTDSCDAEPSEQVVICGARGYWGREIKKILGIDYRGNSL